MAGSQSLTASIYADPVPAATKFFDTLGGKNSCDCLRAASGAKIAQASAKPELEVLGRSLPSICSEHIPAVLRRYSLDISGRGLLLARILVKVKQFSLFWPKCNTSL